MPFTNRSPARRVRSRDSVFALLLAAAIAVNVAQFRAIDESTNARYRAVNTSDTPDVMILGYEQSPNFRERYGVYLALAETSPGSRVLVPDSSGYDDHEFSARLLTLGEATQIDEVRVEADLERLVGDLDPTPFIVARGPGGPHGAPWAIAYDQHPLPDPDEAERFLWRELRDGRRGDSSGPPREFLALRWNTPLAGSGYGHQDLLLETSLLPEALLLELSN